MGTVENPLSQADIDALMRALLPAGGEELFQTKENRLREYDFRRPTKFKKDVLRTLVMVHENFARLLQSFLLASLRTNVQVQVRSTNQYLYAEFIQLLPNPVVVAMIRLNPLPGVCLVEISQNIAYAIVDRVFGGPGSEVQPQRGLSEIELSVIQRMVQDMFNPIQEAWRNVIELKPTLEGMETNPMFLQTSAPSEVMATITLGVQVGEHMGHIALAFPYTTIDPVLERLSPHSWLTPTNSHSEEARRLQDSLQQAPVELNVYLGHSTITVAQFATLKVGDVIMLDTGMESEVPVYVGDHLTFYGRVGVVRGRMSVQITRYAPLQEQAG